MAIFYTRIKVHIENNSYYLVVKEHKNNLVLKLVKDDSKNKASIFVFQLNTDVFLNGKIYYPQVKISDNYYYLENFNDISEYKYKKSLSYNDDCFGFQFLKSRLLWNSELKTIYNMSFNSSSFDDADIILLNFRDDITKVVIENIDKNNMVKYLTSSSYNSSFSTIESTNLQSSKSNTDSNDSNELKFYIICIDKNNNKKYLTYDIKDNILELYTDDERAEYFYFKKIKRNLYDVYIIHNNRVYFIYNLNKNKDENNQLRFKPNVYDWENHIFTFDNFDNLNIELKDYKFMISNTKIKNDSDKNKDMSNSYSSKQKTTTKSCSLENQSAISVNTPTPVLTTVSEPSSQQPSNIPILSTVSGPSQVSTPPISYATGQTSGENALPVTESSTTNKLENVPIPLQAAPCICQENHPLMYSTTPPQMLTGSCPSTVGFWIAIAILVVLLIITLFILGYNFYHTSGTKSRITTRSFLQQYSL
ncbi:MAG: hypothetical protein QW478_00790 [Candidatus Micrarchaeaceae archaeon]